MNKNLLGKVIKNKTPEHGKKILEYFRSEGWDTGRHEGDVCESEGCACIYYGLNYSGLFTNYSLDLVKARKLTIIELPEIEPETWGERRLMWVWDDDVEQAVQRVVIAKNKKGYVAFYSVESLEEAEFVYSTMTWEHVSLTDPRKNKLILTPQIIAEKFNKTVDEIEIKID